MRWFRHEDGWINSAHVICIDRMPDGYIVTCTNGETTVLESLKLYDHVGLVKHEQGREDADQ